MFFQIVIYRGVRISPPRRRVPLQRCKGTKNHRGRHDETSASPPCFICCPAPGPQKRTARLRKMYLASGATVTGLCQRRLGCRPALCNRFVYLCNKAPAAQWLSFPLSSPAQLVGRTNRQFRRHSGSKRVRRVSLPGAGSVALRFLSCCKGSSKKPWVS